MSHLSKNEINQYNEKGYLAPINILTKIHPDKIKLWCRDCTDEHMNVYHDACKKFCEGKDKNGVKYAWAKWSDIAGVREYLLDRHKEFKNERDKKMGVKKTREV